jgi:nucleotide-binding universal stress UspA family protein
MSDNRGPTFTRILVAYDDSPGARRALDIALGLVARESAFSDLGVVAVEPPLPHSGATVGEVEAEKEFDDARCSRWLDAAKRYAVGHGVHPHLTMRTGHPAQELVAAAEAWHADLLVMGHTGHSGVWGRFLGTTAEKVSRHAHCSVLIAAPPEGRGTS